MKPTLFKLTSPPVLRWGDVFVDPRTARIWWAVPRTNSDYVMAWPMKTIHRGRRGCPFSRPLSEKTRDRLEAVRASIWARWDDEHEYDDEECRS